MLDLEQHAILTALGGAFLPNDGAVAEADLAGWAIGDHALSPAWRGAARHFLTADDARSFLRDHGFGSAHDARALATSAWPERLASGHGWCLPVYPRLLRRPGLFTLETLPDESFEIGDATDTAINQTCGTAIDYKFICRQEGYQWLRGYLVLRGDERSGHNVGRSGVTIASGFDLGQQSEAGLLKMGFPQALIQNLAAYLGVQFVAASPTKAHPHAVRPLTAEEMTASIALHGPLPVVSKADADLIDRCAFAAYTETARKAWDALRVPHHPHAAHHHAHAPRKAAAHPAPPAAAPVPPPPVLKSFTALSGNWQTVVLDWVYQNGPGVFAAHDFARAAARGDAAGAKRFLAAASDYRSRRQAEFQLLAGDTSSLTEPAPVMPAAPGAPPPPPPGGVP